MSQNQHEVIIRLTDQATAGMKKIEGQAKNVQSSFSGLAGTLTKAFAGVAVGAMFVSLTSGVEQARIGFETLLGSQEKSLQMMRDIDEFASKTPFEKTTLTPLVQQMIGMGIEAQKALPTLQVLGDSMAALGRSDADLQGVVLALGQIQTKGKVSAEELMQLAERGLPVYKILEDKLNLTKKQLGDIGNAGISSATGINALLTGLNERFGGNMVKMANTLKGQWSNLMDNVKSLVGNSGQFLSNKMRDTLAQINKWFDEHRAFVKKVADDFFAFFGNAFASVVRVAGVFLGAITTVLTAIFGETARTTEGQAKIWSRLLKAISDGFIVVAAVASISLRGIAFAVATLWNGIKIGANKMAQTISEPFLQLANIVEKVINFAISGINKLLTFLGKGTISTISSISTITGNIAGALDDTIDASKENIKRDFSELKDGVLKDVTGMVDGMQANFDQFNKAVDTSAGATSDLQSRISGAITDMGNFGEAGANAGNKNAKGSKEAKDAMKKLSDQAEDAVKKIVDGFDKTKKEIDDAREKLKSITAEWSKYKQEGVKALSDINREIQKFNSETATIKFGIEGEQNEALAKRAVEIKKRLADINKNGDTNGEQNALLEEQAYIMGTVDQAILKQVESYSALSDAQKIVADNQKKMTDELKKREDDLSVMMEKKAILELQANQKAINDRKIKLQEEDGIMKAFYTDTAGKLVEIKNQENVNLAISIQQKQAELEKDYNDTNQLLRRKLSLQKSHLEDLKLAYKQYHDNLNVETKKMSEQLISYYNSISASLREMIALQRSAGMSGGGGGSVGTRAFGGQVSKGEPYIVGENGRELFVPSTSGTIIPNDRLGGGGVNIVINMGSVNVRDDRDIDSLANKVGEVLTRQSQLFKLGIS